MTYSPREDSYLLKDYVQRQELEGKSFLEVGTGSGIVAEAAAEQGAEVTATDVDREALETARKNTGHDIEFIESDLFENVSGEFDLIVFNPPYLPGEREEQDALVGGEEGIEIIEKFLNRVDDYLAEGGKAVVVASSRSSLDRLFDSFDLERVDEEELWFETLYLLRKT